LSNVDDALPGEVEVPYYRQLEAARESLLRLDVKEVIFMIESDLPVGSPAIFTKATVMERIGMINSELGREAIKVVSAGKFKKV